MTERLQQNGTGMPRRDFVKLGAAAAAAVPAGRLGRALGAPQGARRPNIVFVFSDEHRWCSLPFTEMPQVVTPNMERLAREGTRFDNCCSTSPICVPYRGMLITGQWPHQSGCVSNDYFENADVIGVDSPTIAHTFKDAGYVTGYIGKWHLKNATCANAGFDEFQHWLFGDNHWETDVRDVIKGEEFSKREGYNAIGMTDQALDFIDRRAGGENPFMLMLSINPPHWRWDDAPDEFVKLYPDEKLGYRKNVTMERYRSEKERLFYQHYHAHITAVDRELGRIMDALKARGLEEDTVLIYTSDHGSSFGSNDVGSKGNPFDEAIRVPFIARWPGRIPSDRVADHNVGTIDLYPTLCGLAGITPPRWCGGQDFSGVLQGRHGPDPSSQFILVNSFMRNYYRTVLEPGEWNFFYPYRGVRTKQYTYVVNADGEWLLYDNQNDPYQLKNRVDDPDYADVKAGLEEELQRWLARAEDPFIPAAWRSLPLPERIATQNRHYAVERHGARCDAYKAEAIAPYLAKAGQRGAQVRATADRVLDETFFGPYLALHNGIHGKKRYTKRPVAELEAELQQHEAQYAERLKAEVAALQERLRAGAASSARPTSFRFKKGPSDATDP